MCNNEVAGQSQMRPDATLEERLLDILGAYTIVLNGTIFAKDLEYPDVFNSEHKREIVRRCLHSVDFTNKMENDDAIW